MKEVHLMMVYKEYRSAQAAAFILRMLNSQIPIKKPADKLSEKELWKEIQKGSGDQSWNQSDAATKAGNRANGGRIWVSSYRKFWEDLPKAVRKHKPTTIWIMGLGAPDSAEGNELLLKFAQKGIEIHWYVEHGSSAGESWRELQHENFYYENLDYKKAGLLEKLISLFKISEESKESSKSDGDYDFGVPLPLELEPDDEMWCKALLMDAREDDRSRPESRTVAAAYILSQIMRCFRYGDHEAYPKAIEWLAGEQVLNPEQSAQAQEFQHNGQWDYIGRSEKVQQLKTLCQIVGRDSGDCRVLILGESGSGKDLVARMIWDCSTRKSKPFITVNCANFTSELMNSELFGHMKGAFTGAVAARKGLFEEAHKGILFLDEVGELSLELQARLLRVLQTGMIARLGSAKETKVDVRVIAATNRNLLADVQAGRFREDLYYRLAEVSLRTIPFRDMEEDDKSTIALKIWYQISVRRNSWKELTEDDLNLIHQYSWPGNVRQVRNVLTNAFLTQRSVAEVLQESGALGIGNIGAEVGLVAHSSVENSRNADFGSQENRIYTNAGNTVGRERGTASDGTLGTTSDVPYMISPHDILSMDELEKDYARYVLDRCGGVKSKACEVLGIAYNTLMKYVED